MRVQKLAQLEFAVAITLLAGGHSALAGEQKGLTTSSTGAIKNTKTINVKGPVDMESKDSITNGTPSKPATIKSSGSVNLKAPGIYNSGTIKAGGGININTNNLVNSGTIAAPSGDLTIKSTGDKPLNLDNTNGSMTGKSVTISSEGGPVTITGGTIGSKKPAGNK